MNATIKYTVHIITDAEQLTEAFKLRYRIYKKEFPKLTMPGLNYESDKFDCRSIHLGLYCEQADKKVLAGYSRLILPEYFADDQPENMIKDHFLYSYPLEKGAGERLSLLERLPRNGIYENVNSYCEILESKNISYCETSRFIIDEPHRSISISHFFVTSMFAVALSLKIGHALFTCNEHHVPFYNKFGFKILPGTTLFENEIFGGQFIVYGVDFYADSVYQGSFQSLKTQLETENRITYKNAA